MDRGLRFILIIAVIYSATGNRNADDECTAPWRKVHRVCTKFVKVKQSWNYARQECAKEGGQLVSIISMSKKRRILRALRSEISRPGENRWWVGLSFNTTAVRWKWDDGSDLYISVTRWGPGEPRNHRGNQNCAEMEFTGKIFTAPCQRPGNFICERIKITPPPTTSTASVPLTPSIVLTSTSEHETIATELETRPSADKTTISTSTSMASPTTNAPDSESSTISILSKTPQTKVKYIRNVTKVTLKTRKESDRTVTIVEATHITTPGAQSTQEAQTVTPTTKSYTKNPPKGRPSHNTITHCPKIEAYDITWPRTRRGKTAKVHCIKGRGIATWSCSKSLAIWISDPDTSACVSDAYKYIASKLEKTDSENKEVSTKDAVSLATSLTRLNSADKDVSSADLALSNKVIKAVGRAKPRNKEEAKILMKEVLKVGSKLVKKTRSSTAVRKKDKKRAVSKLLKNIEKTAKAVTAAIDVPTVVRTDTENIKLEVHVINTTNTAEEELVYTENEAQDSFSIPIASLQKLSKGGLSKVVFMTHSHISDILTEEDTSDISENQFVVGSNIITASIGNEETVHLSEPITFTMKLTKPKTINMRRMCSFWNFSEGESGNWSQEGCYLSKATETHCTCKCNHLTNFAILLDVTGVEISVLHSSTLKYITYTGCIISLISLFTAWITFNCLSSLQNERNSIHKNLVFCLFAAEVIFLIGIDQVDQKVACAAIALLLHFFFLATFMWMLMEAVHIVIMLVQVFDTAKSRLKYYYMAAYGSPVIIVATTAAINFKAYGTDKYCWLTTDGWFIWSFAGPVAGILLFNAAVLSFSLIAVCRHSEYVFNKGKKTRGGNFKAWIQGALALEVLLGLTWIFGYFFLNSETILLAYIFTVLNSLQGLFIFLFHCVLNKKVRAEYRKLVQVSKTSSLSSSKSASIKKHDRSYEMYVSSQTPTH